MNENDMNKPSKVNLALYDAMTDEMIDTSEIPPLSDEFFKKATWLMPQQPVQVMIEIDPDTLGWFKSQGEDYQRRLTAALRLYMEAHRSFMKEYQAG